jgi:ribosomal-protein-alanine N-acetyltransferase
MIIRATQDHLNALTELEKRLFSKDDFPLSRGSFYYHIKKNELYVFLDEGEVAGYILWLKRKAYYRLYSLGVSSQFRGKGVAQALFRYSFDHIQTYYYSLEVKTTNHSAISLYEKFGFTKRKTLKSYYPNKCDGYLMRKEKSDETQKL